jgi:hypothetical protein
MNEPFYIEVECQQRHYEGQRICGDVFLSRRLKEENRLIAVLSDGMGHGVKANILATLTSTFALNFTREHKDVNTIAEIIMNTLPVCSDRKMSYSTFTIVDVELDGKTHILEYDNPQTIVMRNGKLLELEWTCIILNSARNAGKELRTCSFQPQKEDRIIMWSDGVIQSGMGFEKYPFGWGLESASEFIKNLIKGTPSISASRLSNKMVSRAYLNDNFHLKDDTSCAVLYFREPRKLLICTGPPFEPENDKILSETVKNFKGKKIICGATTADILARELNLEIKDSFVFEDADLPPISYMENVDLVTEGILTLSKVSEILNNYNQNTKLGKGPADQIVRLLKESDEIQFLIGTRINIAHQDPTLPVELEIRRTVARRITRVLEEKFLKEVTMKFI